LRGFRSPDGGRHGTARGKAGNIYADENNSLLEQIVSLRHARKTGAIAPQAVVE
jgi:hypothetical protein